MACSALAAAHTEQRTLDEFLLSHRRTVLCWQQPTQNKQIILDDLLTRIERPVVEADVVLDVKLPVAVLTAFLAVPDDLDAAILEIVAHHLGAREVHVLVADVDPDF